MKNNQSKNKLRKGVYLLPNLLTTTALFAGFFAIISAMEGQFETSAIAILVAMIFDGLDGRVARMTNTQSPFGAEYDSLSDMVSFGIAPSLVMYEWSLSQMSTYGTAYGRLGWVAAFLYTACAALRLARFNVSVGTADKRFFQGLASPAAAAIMVVFIWVGDDLGYAGKSLSLISLAVTIIAGLLMVSNFSYYSFKDLGASKKVPFFALIILLLFFVLTTIDPSKFLLLIFVLYAVSGPFIALFRKIKKYQK
jgi:CDP-diacylglycerol--serine O-phosphatidyltransferase